MDERLHDRLNNIGIVVGILMMMLGLVGEILGWWQDLGLALAIVGTAIGALNLFDRTGRQALLHLRWLSSGQVELGRVVRVGNDQLADEIRSGNEMVVHEIRSGNELVVQEIRSGTQTVVHELRVGNRSTWQRLDAVQQTLDERLPHGTQ